MAKFGDGISWDFHVDQVLADGKNGKEVYYKVRQTFLDEAIKYITTDTELPKRKALDAGCHIGRWIDIVVNLGFEYHGVDQSAKALSVAKANKPHANLYNMMLWDINFQEEFDLVFCIAVLQHNTLEEQERIVPKIYNALKHGGIFFFTESTTNSITVTQRTHINWIAMAEKFQFKFIKSFHKNELGQEDMYIFIKS